MNLPDDPSPPSDPDATRATPPPASSHASPALPGSVLASRYRIVAQLGEGGMGAVVRADDLSLGVPVALKFLTRESDATSLARLREEVRIARAVSHPHVCRMFDIVEADGRSFIAMEYVDGEDLSVLLKRIGRLPTDKALEIARQLCAGLAAAHAEGVIHRDLKPANIMIDGRGAVRITDFGIATHREHDSAPGQIVGTPAYMAPEQFAGKQATEQTDLYALGLVLYEVFTGQSAVDGKNWAELQRAHESSRVAPMTDYVRELDPAVERVIMRCLEKDADRRPASALAVAAALPGGDPLAAALERGETPSPEMVAAAGDRDEWLRPLTCALLLGLLTLSLIGAPFVAEHVSLFERIPDPPRPEVLEQAARDLVAQLGYSTDAADHAFGLEADTRYLEHLRRSSDQLDRWTPLESTPIPAVRFWYRQSERSLLPPPSSGVFHNPTTFHHPPSTDESLSIRLDLAGNLNEFAVRKPRFEWSDSQEPPTPELSWSDVFTLAGLEWQRFEEPSDPPEPTVHFSVENDERRTWIGTLSDEDSTPLRVDAAKLRGRLVAFDTTHPWHTPRNTARPEIGVLGRLFPIAVWIVILLVAVRHVRLGRGDRRGARTVAATIVVFHLLYGLFGVSRVPQEATGFVSALLLAIATSLFFGAVGWLGYVAAEPIVRRHSPHRLVSWQRIMARRWRDPVVGRDLLVGITSGAALTVATAGTYLFVHATQGKPPTLAMTVTYFDVRGALAMIFLSGLLSLVSALVMTILPVFAQSIVRSRTLALVGTWLVLFIYIALQTVALGGAFDLMTTILLLVGATVQLFVLCRFGLLAASAMFFAQITTRFTGTTSLGDWHAAPLSTAIVVLAALGLFAFTTARAAR